LGRVHSSQRFAALTTVDVGLAAMASLSALPARGAALPSRGGLPVVNIAQKTVWWKEVRNDQLPH
jgi:hypothetical protein